MKSGSASSSSSGSPPSEGESACCSLRDLEIPYNDKIMPAFTRQCRKSSRRTVPSPQQILATISSPRISKKKYPSRSSTTSSSSSVSSSSEAALSTNTPFIPSPASKLSPDNQSSALSYLYYPSQPVCFATEEIWGPRYRQQQTYCSDSRDLRQEQTILDIPKFADVENEEDTVKLPEVRVGEGSAGYETYVTSLLDWYPNIT